MSRRVCQALTLHRRATAQCLVDGYSGAEFMGFPTLAKATAYLGDGGHQTFVDLCDNASSKLAPERESRKNNSWIAVAEGRHTGIYPCYKYRSSYPGGYEPN